MIYVDSVNVKESYIRLILNEVYYTPQAIISPANATCPYVTWSTSHPDVVSVDPEFGNIRALKAGTAMVHATAADGGGASDHITVRVVEGPVSNISIESYLDLPEGGRGELNAVLSPSTATYADIVWTSDDPEIATVTGGIVNAKKAGSTFIRAVAVDNTSIFDTCYVTVTPVEKLVTSISLNETSISKPTQTSIFLRAAVTPSDATNKTIKWTSSNESVATVTQSGYVSTKNVGHTTITAKATDGSGVQASCYIEVTKRIPVTGIELSEQEAIMNVGDTKTLQATIIPSDASSKTVMWYSCCPEIASVGLYTGEITAHKVGTVDIYAEAANGSITAKCTLRVVIENVTIKQDGGFRDVIFEKSGKIWKCIGHDMLYGTSEIDTSFLIERCNYNYFKYPNQTLIPYDYKNYTDDELKLLYAIDPHGVAEYIYRYADRVVTADPTDTRDNALLYAQLKYKDERYEAIFGKKPKYFKRIATTQIEWVETSNTNNIEAVLSASESLFGFRKVDDEITYWAKREFNLKVIKAIVSCCFNALTKKCSALKEFLDEVNPYVQLFEMSVIMTEDECAAELVKYSATQVVSELFNYTNLSWAGEILALIDDLSELDRTFIPDVNFCGKITSCYAENVYNITLETINGNRFPVKDIHEAIDMLN